MTIFIVCGGTSFLLALINMAKLPDIIMFGVCIVLPYIYVYSKMVLNWYDSPSKYC
jgi:hypothetical protein